jgi:prophage regulatory protein
MTQNRIIRRHELRQRINYSDVHVWRLEKLGKFPQRVKIGPNSVGWVESEIDSWIQKRIDDRD